MKYANDEILTIATAFMTNEPKYGVNIGIICDHDHKTQYLYEAWSMEGFMDEH